MTRSSRQRDRRPGSRMPPLPSMLTLSVVMPVYNEAGSVATVIDDVLALEIPDTSIELVIIESNSGDGSRDVVAGYEGRPGVTVIYEDEPLGKGHAVRRGLERATGEIVLIQDADLEYRVDDYPRLLAPIIHGDADFVLGCRHVPGEPIRIMPSNRRVAWVVNAAHWGFTGLFNLFYRVRLRDPFTMYKVFRRDCIEGVEFVANRFDFDWELVAKLIRLGHRPLEVPVRYDARSFDDGKKVRFFRDPPTWVVACVRFRVTPVKRKTPAPSSGPMLDH